MNEEIIKVGISEMKLAIRPQILRTSGLGSCVGVIIYDLTKGIGGMAHVMLPESNLAKAADFSPGKYANTAIPGLIAMLKNHVLRPEHLEAKLSGGAQMFKFSSDSETTRIGVKNVLQVKEALKKYQIPIVAEDIGGNKGRTIEFSLITGKLVVKKVGHSMQVI